MLVEGRGCTLRDQFGNEYLDGNASIWTNIHGHCHPVINAAINEQLGKVAHTSFLGFTHEPAIRLAKELVDLVPGDNITRAFFTDNGSTAIESAVRMALQFWKQNGRPQRDTLIALIVRITATRSARRVLAAFRSSKAAAMILATASSRSQISMN